MYVVPVYRCLFVKGQGTKGLSIHEVPVPVCIGACL